MNKSFALADDVCGTRMKTIRTALTGILIFHAPYSFAARVTLEALPWLEIAWARIWHSVVVLLAREGSGAKIDYQMLFYPGTDANVETPSSRQFANSPWLTEVAMKWFWYASTSTVPKFPAVADDIGMVDSAVHGVSIRASVGGRSSMSIAQGVTRRASIDNFLEQPLL